MMRTNNDEAENLSPEVLKRLGKDLIGLQQDPPEGIKLILNEKNLADIQFIIDGPSGTPYEGGKFRVQLILPKEFPSVPPRGYFLTKVFHPNVATPSGEICVNTLKKDWTSDLGLRHVFLTIRCLLIAPNAESALNEEAGKLLLENYESFAKRARMFTEVHALPRSSQADGLSQGSNNGSEGSKRGLTGGGTDGDVPARKKTKETNFARKQLKRL